MFLKTGKHLVLESLFNKVAGPKACNFTKKRLQHRCFPVNIAKFLRRIFFIEHFQWLLFLMNPHSKGIRPWFRRFNLNILNYEIVTNIRFLLLTLLLQYWNSKKRKVIKLVEHILLFHKTLLTHVLHVWYFRQAGPNAASNTL